MKNKNKKRGAELMENMIVMAIVVTLAFVLFYPLMSDMFTLFSDQIQLKFLDSMNLLN